MGKNASACKIPNTVPVHGNPTAHSPQLFSLLFLCYPATPPSPLQSLPSSTQRQPGEVAHKWSLGEDPRDYQEEGGPTVRRTQWVEVSGFPAALPAFWVDLALRAWNPRSPALSRVQHLPLPAALSSLAIYTGRRGPSRPKPPTA